MLFQQTQQLWGQYLRNPNKHTAPVGIEARRLKIYEELLFNNIESFLANNFPVLKSLYCKGINRPETWQHLVRDFFEQHHCASPYFSEIGDEFIDYLRNERQPQADDFSFMLELAHYEWMELALEIADIDFNSSDHINNSINTAAELKNNNIIVNPALHISQYQYPVHQISTEHIPEQPLDNPIFLAIYRDLHDKVRFCELNTFSAHLLHALQHQPQNGQQVLQQLAIDSQHPDPEQLIEAGLQTLFNWYQQNILLGIQA